jgi:hypothetical protein
MTCSAMTMKFMEKSKEVNIAELRIIEKVGLIKWLSEQLESESPRSCLAFLSTLMHHMSVFKPLDLHGRYPQQGRR